MTATLEGSRHAARELSDSPIPELINLARTMVGDPARRRDLDVMFETIDRLIEREIKQRDAELRASLYGLADRPNHGKERPEALPAVERPGKRKPGAGR